MRRLRQTADKQILADQNDCAQGSQLAVDPIVVQLQSVMGYDRFRRKQQWLQSRLICQTFNKMCVYHGMPVMLAQLDVHGDGRRCSDYARHLPAAVPSCMA
jgi:hypothetical protein